MKVQLALASLLMLGLTYPSARSAPSAPLPAVSEFSGTWKISRMVGASNGGLTGDDPKAIIGKIVRWTSTDVQSPNGVCHLRQPTVALFPNYLLETSIWGGQKINDLSLSRAEIAQGFGKESTPVFQDPSGCANAILIGRNHMLEEFNSGWIYRLDRIH